MGLECSHDAFCGTYAQFDAFRSAVAKAANVDRRGRKAELGSGLRIFLAHSDCYGELTPDEAANVAMDLEKVLSNLEQQEGKGVAPLSPRLDDDEGIVDMTKRFIAGCRRAAAAGEALNFR